MTNTLYPQVSNDCVNHFVFFSDDDDDDGDDDDDDSLPDTMLRLANESVWRNLSVCWGRRNDEFNQLNQDLGKI